MLNNYLYVHDNTHRRLPPILLDKFDFIQDSHDHNTRHSILHCVKLPTSRTLVYGLHSITGQSARAWNYLQINYSSDNLHSLSRNLCKKKLTSYFIESY